MGDGISESEPARHENGLVPSSGQSVTCLLHLPASAGEGGLPRSQRRGFGESQTDVTRRLSAAHGGRYAVSIAYTPKNTRKGLPQPKTRQKRRYEKSREIPGKSRENG